MKKLISFIMASIFLFSFSMTTMAAGSSDDAYKNILNEINEEYGLDIGYSPVDASAISLDTYEHTVRSVAIQQKELNDFIVQRQEHPLSEISTYAEPRATKTITKDVWNYETTFEINATYDVNGNSISNPRSISVSRKLGATLNGIFYSPNSGSPSTKIIDSGRTLTVTYLGTWSTIDGLSLANVKFYTEFYYDS